MECMLTYLPIFRYRMNLELKMGISTMFDFLYFFKSQQVLNFTYDLTQPPDGQWGAIQPDGTWSGLVGMLMRDEIDIGKC